MRWHILASGFVLICMIAPAEGQGAPFKERFSDFSTSPKSIKTEKIIGPPKTATAPKLAISRPQELAKEQPPKAAISPQQPINERPPPAVKEQKLSRREVVEQIRQEVKKSMN
jgi:hypothetical protein